jgi:hypothetical protein
MILKAYLVSVGRHCEERSDEAIHKDFPGLPRRYAPRNDEFADRVIFHFFSSK